MKKVVKWLEILRREFIYIWYYFTVQLEQIFYWWVLGTVIGSAVSVFAKDYIHSAFRLLQGRKIGFLGIAAASALGIASPLCMYGTIPIAASFSKSGMKDSWLAAFMMSSILLNPQLIIYSAALGGTVMTVRIVSCFFCGITAGLLLHFLYKNKPFFNFSGFDEPKSKDIDPNLLMRYLKNLWRNVKATGPYFLICVLLSALFQRYYENYQFGRFKNRFGAEAVFVISGLCHYIFIDLRTACKSNYLKNL